MSAVADTPLALYGREAEQELIGQHLDNARASRSGTLVLRGEPGVGKSALLRDARERAADMQLLAARGSSPSLSCPSQPSTNCSVRRWATWTGCPRRSRRRSRAHSVSATSAPISFADGDPQQCTAE